MRVCQALRQLGRQKKLQLQQAREVTKKHLKAIATGLLRHAAWNVLLIPRIRSVTQAWYRSMKRAKQDLAGTHTHTRGSMT